MATILQVHLDGYCQPLSGCEKLIKRFLILNRGQMNTLRKIMLVLVLTVLVIGSVGCEEKGPAEKAGEQLDKAMEDASKKAGELLGK